MALYDELDLFGVDPADVVELDRDTVRAELTRRVIASLPAWHARAECRGAPTQWFFPVRGERPKAALELCSRCSVRQECLDEALADPALDIGVRGGMAGGARRDLRLALGKRRNVGGSVPSSRQEACESASFHQPTQPKQRITTMADHSIPVSQQDAHLLAVALLEAGARGDLEAIAALNTETDVTLWQGVGHTLSGLLLAVLDQVGTDRDAYIATLRATTVNLRTHPD